MNAKTPTARALLVWLKKEPVLLIAGACALITAAFVPPSADYLSYLDLRVLCLLFCLMVVVAGFQDCRLFALLAQKLLDGRDSFRLVALALVLLPFFSSMLITNDVALLTFVPFTILVLSMARRPQYLIYYTVLQTLAANLGSILLPIGNPQNLYLYSQYGISFGPFFRLLAPYGLVSLLLLSLAALAGGRGVGLRLDFPEKVTIRNQRLFGLLCFLFLLCLLSVFRVLHYAPLLLIVAGSLLLFAPRLLKKADYGLLLTFFCFFIFVGNLGQIPAVRSFLEQLLSSDTLLSTLALSQLISNVPAAVLLSGFTSDWQGLLLGTNIGGLGTLVASLASLISFKLYLASEKPEPKRYLLVFTAANLVGLAALLMLAFCLGQL